MPNLPAPGRHHLAPIGSPGEPPVLLIVGAPRSGTSLVYRALCLHPEASWISGWQRRLPTVPAVSRLNRSVGRRPDLAIRCWFPGGNAYVYGRRRSLIERLVPAPVEGEPVLRAAGVPDPNDGVAATPPAPEAADAARRHLAAIARHSGGEVLVGKRIANNRRLAWWASALPSVRVVDVTRDGRAVSASLRRVDWWPREHLWWAGTTVAGWERAGGDPIEACARHWQAELDVIEAGLAALPAEQVLRIRYEDLIDEPLATLGLVATFGGLGPSARWDAARRSLPFPDRNERWRSQLDASERAVVESVAAEGLARHAYSTAAP